MKSYKLDDFWIRRLGRDNKNSSAGLIEGWSFPSGHKTFTEAPLVLDEELSNGDDPETCPILLVSAPGAVGKSTLARQIAHETGAIYVDLALAQPVGANTLIGGLVRSGVYQQWMNESTTVLIDGLDEARLKVTQEAFQAFLADIAELSANRSMPTVLFGRTGAIQEAWLELKVWLESNDVASGVSVLEIGYFGVEKSVEFAEAHVREEKPGSQFSAVEREVLELLLQGLRSQTGVDGNRFAGYAPVLLAVAKHVSSIGNPHALIQEISQGAQPVTLPSVTEDILVRERGKLDALRQSFEDTELAAKLYSPPEQLDRLVARFYGLQPPEAPPMSPSDAKTYANALGTWVAEHPFLDGDGGTPSAVFEAVISAWALLRPRFASEALAKEMSRAAANPFVHIFYDSERDNSGVRHIQPEHIGVFYASLRASLSLGDRASLFMEADEDSSEADAELEILLDRRDHDGEYQSDTRSFATDATGPVFLGTYLEDIDMSMPHALVEIGPGTEALLVSPINVECRELNISTNRVVAERPSGSSEQQGSAISLVADDFDGTVTSVTIVRNGVVLSTSWPGGSQYPWTSFFVQSVHPDPRTDEAIRRLRKFVIVFRSHGRGGLARSTDKIESLRMTKGTGQAVLDLMLREGILTRERPRYHLNPDRLAQLTGATYVDIRARRFGPEMTAFVQRALS